MKQTNRSHALKPEVSSISRIVAIFQSEMKIRFVEPDDDFFDLGGDSLMAENIVLELQREFNLQLQTAILLTAASPYELAKLIQDKLENGRAEGIDVTSMDLQKSGSMISPDLINCLVTLQSGGNLPPLFMIHGRNGLLFPKREFMSGFHPEQPVYALQTPGHDGRIEPLDRIEDIAEKYLDLILQINPSGPFFLAAFCNGSWIAVEIVRLLKKRGIIPEFVVLIDPGALNGDMREEYYVNRGKLSQSNIAGLSFGWRQLKRYYFWISRRVHCFWYTRRWQDFKSRDAYQNPAVAKWITARRHTKLNSLKARTRTDTPKKLDLTDLSPKDCRSTLHEISGDVAAYALAKMQTAFWNHNPKHQSNFAYDLIVSTRKRRELSDINHPINWVMKSARIKETGETHRETVGALSSKNSKFMQQKILAVVHRSCQTGTTNDDDWSLPTPSERV